MKPDANPLFVAMTKVGLSPDHLIKGSLLESHSEYMELATSMLSEEPDASRAFQLLGNICSLILKDDDWAEPYWPLFQSKEGRTFLPQDLTNVELEFIKIIAPNIENKVFAARCNDLVWLISKQRSIDYSYALAAVKHWISAGTESKYWFHEGEANWRRAAEFAKRFQLKFELEQITSKLLEASFECKDPIQISQIFEILFLFKLSADQASKMVDVLKSTLTSQTDGSVRRDFLEKLHKLEISLNRVEDAWAEIELIGMSWIEEVEVRRKGITPSEMVSATFLEYALRELKRIPTKYRSNEVLKLLKSLPLEIHDAGVLSLEEMHEISSNPIDLSKVGEDLREKISNKPILEALAEFCNCAIIPSLEIEKESAINESKGSIRDLVSVSVLSEDGRKIFAPVPNKNGPFGIPETIWFRMLTNYQVRLHLTFIALINPGLDILSSEHHLRIRDFEVIVESSTLIPKQQQKIFALGLRSGFYGDFASALHLIVPQIEAMVRHHLKDAGVKTTFKDRDFVESENSLSTLLELPEAIEVFGIDLVYNLRAIFCGPSGPNVRNDLAHGLIGYETAQGALGGYVWWFALKLSFTYYFNSLRGDRANS